MLIGYLKLTVAALLPVLASVLFRLLHRHTAFARRRVWVQQAVIGVVFGLIAIVGTEWAIPVNGVLLNCRDAAPLCAGLLFGGPAGIIAGVMGGVERWIAVAWGAGTVTRLACTVSTILAGLYAAALRRFLFDNKRPAWSLALAIGVVMEVFHLTMVFVTNLNNAGQAAQITRSCLAMVPFVGVSVMLSAMLVSLLSKESLHLRVLSRKRITDTIQRQLLICVVVAFAITSCFVFVLQSGLWEKQSLVLLSRGVEDVEADIRKATDSDLLTITHAIADALDSATPEELAERYQVAEVNVVDRSGIITRSTNPDFVGYDMASGEQSAPFMELLQWQTELVQDYGPISYDASLSRKYAGVSVPGGFVQVGYDADTFQSHVAQRIAGFTALRHVGNTGCLIIADKDGKICSAPETIRAALLSQLLSLSDTAPMTVFSATINDVPCHCLYDESEGYTVVSVLPKEETTVFRDAAVLVNAFLEVLVFAVLFGMIYRLIKRVVLNNLHSVNQSLSQISGGNLNVVVNVRPNEEFASLSDDINTTVDTLKHYIDEAAKRLDQELEFAKSIQHSALPTAFPAFPQCPEFDIYATMHTAKEVGGDFYDFYLTGERTLNFAVADVSGKGIPAALFMMRSKTQLKSLAENGLPIDEVFTRGNAQLCEGNDADMFVTAWMGQLDPASGLVSFANAGHNPPLLYHRGSFSYLRSKPGLVLAGMDGIRYRRQEVQLSPGDVLVLYTDGVTEATDAHNQLYGEERLLKLLNATPTADMQALCRAVKADVDAFVGEAPQFDDITLLALRYDGPPPVPEIHFDRAAIDDIPVVTAFVEEELEKLDCPMKAVIQLSVAIDEIYSNIVKYAYGPAGGPATVRLERREDGVSLCFMDEGKPYNPVKEEDPDITRSAEEREIGGLGIYMVKKSMDDMSYEYSNRRNILRLYKKF